MERVLCREKRRRSSDCERILPTSCLRFVHCSADALNLVLVKSCAIPEIHSSIDFVGDIASFLNQAVKEMND